MNNKLKVCKHCEKEIDCNHSIFANHVRWCDKNITNGDKGVSNNKISKLKRYELKYGEKKTFSVRCYKCDLTFQIIENELKFPKKDKYFCSRFCANSRQHSEETKNIMSQKSKLLWEDERYAISVIKNNTNKNKRFTSRGEEEIRNYFISNYKDDEWTFGGGFKYEGHILTRDLYSNKLKTIVEYDGIWHFKDIHGQLIFKQTKDHLLEKWTVENGWRLIRIKDELYNKNKYYYLDLLKDSIYLSNEIIIKIF